MTKWYETDLSKAIMAKKYFHEGEDFKSFIDRVVSIFSKDLQPKMREALMNGDFFLADVHCTEQVQKENLMLVCLTVIFFHLLKII